MNIFEITQSYQELINTIEENGGEVTPEIEEALAITEEQFKDKTKSYVEVIKQAKSDMKLIKEETERLANLKKSKEKLIERLTDILTDAIETFGDKSKSGTSFVDYGTGKVSVRHSTAVEVDDVRVKDLGTAIELDIACNKATNQLDVVSALDIDDVNSFKISGVPDNDMISYTPEEFENIDLTLTVKMPAIDLLTGDAYSIAREMAKYTDDFNVTSSLNKTEVKKKLIDDGCLLPNLARLKQNKSLTIK